MADDPVYTRTQVWEHLLANVLKGDDDNDDTYRKAFQAAKVTKVSALMALELQDLKDITWTDGGATQQLAIGQVKHIMALIAMLVKLDSLDPATLMQLTEDDLDGFILSLHTATNSQGDGPEDDNGSFMSANDVPHTMLPRPVLSAAAEFKKGIKRDITAFTVYRERKAWETWYREFSATAKAQGLGNVLDPDYVPATLDDDEVFKLEQEYTFAVFTKCLKQSEASELVLKFTGPQANNDEGNAQKLHSELVQLMTSGIVARNERQRLEGVLSTTKLNNSWNKGIVAFLLFVSKLIYQLKQLRPPGDTSYGDVWCIHQLDVSLVEHKDMSSHVQSLASTRMAMGMESLSFEKYLEMVKTHAYTLDQLTKPRPRRRVNTGRRGTKDGTKQKKDVTDPSVYLSNQEYNKLTKEQKQERYQKKQAKRQAKLAQLQNTIGGTVDPGTALQSVAVNNTQVQETQSVMTNPPAAPVQQPGSILRTMMANQASARPTSNDTITVDGVVYQRTTSMAQLSYRVSNQDVESKSNHGSLIDGGANGGLLGQDARVLERELNATADVVGIAGNTLESLPICQAAAVIDTVDDGPIVGIFSHYAEGKTGKTIHSKAQMEHFGLVIDDTSITAGGTQTMVTTEGYVLPLHIRDGLPYLDMRPPTDEELDTLPHVFMTSDSPWDPSVMDCEFNADGVALPAIASERRTAALNGPIADSGTVILSHPQSVKTKLIENLDSLRPNFGWAPLERIKKTLEGTTQYYRASVHHPFRKHFKSRFPAANVHRLPEWVSTDTIFSDTPALDDGIPGHGGCTMLQVYGGLDSHFLAGYPLHSESFMATTLQDYIRDHGAMFGLASDNAKSETSSKVKDILRAYCIKDRQSEPYYEHQNFVERKIQDIKRMTSNIMDRVGAPGPIWLLCMLYVICLLNHLVNVNGVIPKTVVTNEVTDTSAFLQFHFWQEVFYEDHVSEGEKLGRWVGIAEKQGDALTYLVLTSDTQQVIVRSNVRAAKDAMFPNRLQRPPDNHSPIAGGEVNQRPAILSLADVPDIDPAMLELPTFSPEELLGLTFLKQTEDGQTLRAKVTRKIMDRDAENHQNIKFLVSCGDDDYEEIMAYNELSAIIEQQHKAEADGEMDVFTFKEVVDHQGPLSSTSQFYKGSSWNVQVHWEDGSKTWEPLNMVAKDDPVTLATYAKENGLLDTPGWKFLRRIAKNEKKMKRMLNQSRMRSMKTAIKYKFGVRVPKNVKEALALDKENGNTLWADAMALEIAQLREYNTFKSVGFGAPIPHGYKKIPAHMIFDVKQSGKRKARFVAGGHRTDPPKESVYSSVVSLRSLRLVCFLAELNGLQLMAGDVGNAYLEAHTKEKVCFTAGPEFGELAGHTMVIDKALYGLRSSGARFHEKFADTLRAFGFSPSYADPDVWLRDAGDTYEYVCVYVDDLLVAMKDPKPFMDALQDDPWNYKLKGVEEPKYHLGGDFYRDPDGTLCYSANTYINRMVSNYYHLFGELPKTYLSPLVKGDHPELDVSEPCTADETVKYQSLIGALQWTISLCRSDISVAVMTLGRYRAAPLQGHLQRAKRIVGYLKKYSHAAIRFRTGIPDHESMYGEPAAHDWMYSVYGNPKEQVPHNAPTPKGKPVRTTSFVDANLMHDFTTGRSVTGVLHMVNQTPIAWFSKRQGQVETATYGSEFVAARTATEQIIDLRYTLRMLGVPLDGPSWLFGDNQSVVTSSTIPHSTLSKRWNALSYHRVREAVAAGVIRFEFIDGKQNPADFLTKHCDHSTAWPHIDTLLFRKGSTLSQSATNTGERGVSN